MEVLLVVISALSAGGLYLLIEHFRAKREHIREAEEQQRRRKKQLTAPLEPVRLGPVIVDETPEQGLDLYETVHRVEEIKVKVQGEIIRHRAIIKPADLISPVPPVILDPPYTLPKKVPHWKRRRDEIKWGTTKYKDGFNE